MATNYSDLVLEYSREISNIKTQYIPSTINNDSDKSSANQGIRNLRTLKTRLRTEINGDEVAIGNNTLYEDKNKCIGLLKKIDIIDSHLSDAINELINGQTFIRKNFRFDDIYPGASFSEESANQLNNFNTEFSLLRLLFTVKNKKGCKRDVKNQRKR